MLSVQKAFVTLEYNRKDPETMKGLKGAILKINALDLKPLSGKAIEFKVGGIDHHLISTN